MNERLNNALAALAEKLGTSVDHLWGVLVRQASIEGGIALFQGAAIILAVIVWWRYRGSATVEDWEYAGPKAIGVIASGALILTLAIIAFFCIPETITKLLNPEYWALNRILSALGG